METGKSHREPNLLNTLVSISFATSTRRLFYKKFRFFGTSLVATRFIPKTWTTMCWVDPQQMLRAFATSLMTTRRFSSKNFFTFSMLSSLTEVDGRLAWGKFSTISQPSLNALCHSNTCVFDWVLPKTLLKHFQWFRSRNSIGNTKFQANSLFNIFFHSKNRQTNFSLRKPMAAKHTLMDVSRSNFTRLSKKVLPT